MSDVVIGRVSAVSNGVLSIVPDGSVTSVKAVDCCGASVNDRVVIIRHVTELAAVAVVGGGLRVKASGTSNGWEYRKWSDGTVEAWMKTPVTFDSGLEWRKTVNTPVTMANAEYIAFITIADYKVSQCYIGQRTTTSMAIAVRGTSSDTSDAWLYLRGVYA